MPVACQVYLPSHIASTAAAAAAATGSASLVLVGWTRHWHCRKQQQKQQQHVGSGEDEVLDSPQMTEATPGNRPKVSMTVVAALPSDDDDDLELCARAVAAAIEKPGISDAVCKFGTPRLLGRYRMNVLNGDLNADHPSSAKGTRHPVSAQGPWIEISGDSGEPQEPGGGGLTVEELRWPGVHQGTMDVTVMLYDQPRLYSHHYSSPPPRPPISTTPMQTAMQQANCAPGLQRALEQSLKEAKGGDTSAAMGRRPPGLRRVLAAPTDTALAAAGSLGAGPAAGGDGAGPPRGFATARLLRRQLRGWRDAWGRRSLSSTVTATADLEELHSVLITGGLVRAAAGLLDHSAGAALGLAIWTHRREAASIALAAIAASHEALWAHVDWLLMGTPAGLKLHAELNELLGRTALLCLEAVATLSGVLLGPGVTAAAEAAAASAGAAGILFGVSGLLTLLLDLLTLAAAPVLVMAWAYGTLYRWQLRGIAAMWSLIRSPNKPKHSPVINPQRRQPSHGDDISSPPLPTETSIRSRVRAPPPPSPEGIRPPSESRGGKSHLSDSAGAERLSVERLIVGVLLFTPLLLLLPTTAAYASLFGASNQQTTIPGIVLPLYSLPPDAFLKVPLSA